MNQHRSSESLSDALQTPKVNLLHGSTERHQRARSQRRLAAFLLGLFLGEVIVCIAVVIWFLSPV